MRRWPLVATAGCLAAIALMCAVVVAGAALFVVTDRSVDVRGLLPDDTGAVNRLVVQAADGNIYTVNPDGSDTIALTDDASRTHVYQQPTWSPTADRIAWAEIDVDGDQPRSALVTARPDGSGTTRADTRFPAFYLSWSPDGSRLAYLSNWDSGLALNVLDVDGGGTEVDMLEQGQPLYFSWAPDGRQLFAHIDASRLTFFTIDGEQRPLEADPAPFPAPQWSADGSRLVYAVDTEDEQHLVVTDDAGTDRVRITSFDGSIAFALSPDGTRLAYVETQRSVGTNAFGPLFLTDLETNATRELSRVPVLAFFWSPDGRYLLFLRPAENQEPEPEAISTERQEDELWLRWDVWNGERTYPLSRFVPSTVYLRDYLRFFDQYARSMTPWAPDSSAFVYTGRTPDGTEGVWVHPVDEGSTPTFLTEGVYAAWSPR